MIPDMGIFSSGFTRAYEWFRNAGGKRAVHPVVRQSGILFIHIPKNAGTSISHALYGREIGHHPIAWYRDRFPHSLAGIPSFALIRDPVSRFVSAFLFLKDGGMNREDAAFAREKLAAFGDPLALAEACTQPDVWRNLQARHHHFKTQCSFVVWRGRTAVDFLLRFEDLPACLEKLPLPKNQLAGLERRNPTRSFTVPDDARKLRELLRKICPEDFALWESL
jgi:hypothetical protein